MTGSRSWAGSYTWALLAGVVCLSVSQMPASAQHTDTLVSSDGARIAVKATEGTTSPSFEGSGRTFRSGPAESAAEFQKLLNARPMTAPQGIESIIPPGDQRVRVNPTTTYPARATVLITFNVPGGSARCTGWLIGKDTVATAGHCVAKGNNTGFYNRASFKIYPGRNGAAAPYGFCTARTLYTNTIWINSGADDYDYGMIKLNCSVGNAVGWYGFFWQAASLLNRPVSTQGYPGDKPLTQWKSSDRVRVSQTRRVFYQADTVGGQSGSPVYENRSNGPYGMAIHAYGTYGSPPFSTNNHGTRITQTVFNQLVHVKNLP